MKYYQRVLVSLYSILMALLALFVLLVVLGWQQPIYYIQLLMSQDQARILTAIVAGLVFLLGVKLFFDGFRPSKMTQASIQNTSLGEVNITTSALENMVKKAVKAVSGIYNLAPQIKCTSEGIAVFVKVQLEPEKNIPQTTSEIQTAIKEYLGTYAGIQLLEVRVLVDDTPKDLKSRVE